MKHAYLLKPLLLFVLLFSAIASKAQQNDDLLNLLIKKNVVSQTEADSIRADIALQEQAKKDKQSKFPISAGKALNFSGLLQTRYQGAQSKSAVSGFDVRRARLILSGAIDSHWNYYTQTELAGAGAKVLDAYINYKWADYFGITAGQFKIPFSLESLTGDGVLELVDRSQVVEALSGRSKDVIGNVNGRDIGVQIGGSFLKNEDFYVFDYTLGIFNGAGANTTGDNERSKDFGGRFSVHPIKNLAISYDFYHGFAALGTPLKTQLRNRQGIDAHYVIGALSLTGEYDKGTDGHVKRDGWYGQAAYFVLPKKVQLAAKYETYDPTKTIKTDRSNWYTGGVNYYPNTWTRFTIDYSYRREEVETKQVRNNLLVAQLQLSF